MDGRYFFFEEGRNAVGEGQRGGKQGKGVRMRGGGGLRSKGRNRDGQYFEVGRNGVGGEKRDRISGGKQGKGVTMNFGGGGRGERFNGTRMGGISRKEVI